MLEERFMNLASVLQLDLQISGAGLVNFVFTKWLRPTYAGKIYAILALNSLNLHRAPVSLVLNKTESRSLLE